MCPLLSLFSLLFLYSIGSSSSPFTLHTKKCVKCVMITCMFFGTTYNRLCTYALCMENGKDRRWSMYSHEKFSFTLYSTLLYTCCFFFKKKNFFLPQLRLLLQLISSHLHLFFLLSFFYVTLWAWRWVKLWLNSQLWTYSFEYSENPFTSPIVTCHFLYIRSPFFFFFYIGGVFMGSL